MIGFDLYEVLIKDMNYIQFFKGKHSLTSYAEGHRFMSLESVLTLNRGTTVN